MYLSGQPHERQHGFTIVELLIVIVVIAILAAITIVAYNGIQNRAYDASVQSDLKTLAKKYEIYKIDQPSGTYPLNGALGTAPGGGFNTPISQQAYTTNQTYNVMNCTKSSATEYAVYAQSKSGKYFMIGSASSNVQEVTASVTLNSTSYCSTILPGSSANGVGWDSTSGWRPWTSGN